MLRLANLAVDRLGGKYRELNGFAVEDRQRSGQAKARRADVRIGLAAILVDAATEGLRLGHQLHVYFKADDGLVPWREPQA